VRRILAVTLALALPFLATSLHAGAAPQVAPWGVYVSYFDKSVKPGDDFFEYANGTWLKTAEIPSDRPSAGAGFEVTKQNEDRLKAIIAGLRADAKPGSEERKLRDLHDAFLDEAQIEALGLDPVKADLERIASVKTLDDVARLMNEPRLALDGPFNMIIGADDKDPDSYAVAVFQSGLGLPERDYYLKEDESLAKTRDAYKQYLAQILGFAGRDNAATRAAAVYDLERAIAEAHWPAADRREAEKMYNPMTISELRSLAPGFPWNAYIEAARIPLQSPKGERRRYATRSARCCAPSSSTATRASAQRRSASRVPVPSNGMGSFVLTANRPFVAASVSSRLKRNASEALRARWAPSASGGTGRAT
jgi:predicted metalloendopeptidase